MYNFVTIHLSRLNCDMDTQAQKYGQTDKFSNINLDNSRVQKRQTTK